MATLTQGAVSAFSQSREMSNPRVQVVDIKKIEGGPEKKERFRLIVSDGINYTQAMLSTQLNHYMHSGTLQTNCIITLNEYICNEVQGRNIVIILALELSGKAPQKIGNPVNIENKGGAAQPKPQQQQFQQQQQQQSGGYNAPQQKHPQQQGAPRQYAPPPAANQFNNQFSGSGPVVKQPNMMQASAINEQHLTPIRALNPYQNRWTFKARVTNKSDMRTWDKGGNNKGKLFSIECVDKDGSEIRCTFFKDAADAHYDVMVPGEVFTFSKGVVKMANKAFNTTNNDYEITFGRDCDIQPCANDATIKAVSLNPVPIASINPASGVASVDVIGVITDFSELQQFTSRAGKELTKMEVTLADTSNASVRVTMWGDKAREYSAQLSQSQPNQIMAIKSCKVSDYNGCSLSTISNSSVYLNPEIAESQTLQSWLGGGGLNNQLQSKSQQSGGGARAPKGVTERHTLSSFEQCGLGQADKGDYVDVQATITYVKRENMWYPACPEEGENKKVVQQTDGSWFCEKNGKTYPNCEYRYILNCSVSDYSGSRWITCFNETGMQLLGNRSADDVEALKQSNEAAFDQVILDANFTTYNMCLRVKEETRDDEARLRCSLVRLTPVDFATEGKQLLAAIQQY